MRIALTGASSTGKTTLLNDLLRTAVFKRTKIVKSQLDVRKILHAMGIRADGKNANRQQLRDFQWALLEEKIRQESVLGSYITDRSTVDMAAYWITRDAINGIDADGERYLEKCQSYASRFDVHIYLPFGKIPFNEDGQRPIGRVYNENSCKAIQELLEKWNLPHVTLIKTEPHERVEEVLSFLMQSKLE